MSVCLLPLALALTACTGSGPGPVDATQALAIIARSANASAADAAAARVFNASGSVRPGDIVTLQGDNFGHAPIVRLEATGSNAAAELPLVDRAGAGWLAVRIPPSATGALILRVDNGRATGAPLHLNGAVPHHLDAMELVPGGPFRVLGRNLRLTGFTPSVTVDGQAATVDMEASDEHMLVVTAPTGLLATDAASIAVDNGNGTGPARLDRRITVSAAATGDPLGTGVGWTAAFAPLLERPVDAAGDPRLAAHVRCDGVTDDAPALRAAMVFAHRQGGGTVLLPAGTCVLGSGVQLFDRTVLQGAGKDRTELRHATDSALHADRADLLALRDLTLRAAIVSGSASSSLNLKRSRRVAVQRLRVEIGSTAMAWLHGITNLAVVDSEFLAHGDGAAPGALHLASNAGLHLARNRFTFFDGIGTNLDRTSDAYVAGNSWLRDADRQRPSGVVHVVTINFAHRIAIVGNRFDAVGRPLAGHTNDGETILTEGGGPSRTEGLGRVAAAGLDTLTDPQARVHPNVPVDGSLPENFGISIVAGTGAGQSRQVTAFAGGTFTIDRPWDVVPDASSRYATALWGLERALIKDNELRNQPRGIWLYSTAVREVDIVGNRLEDSGGILVRAFQKLAQRAFTPVFNVRIDGNRIRNDARRYPSHLSVHFANLDGLAFGTSHIGVQVRRNVLTATGTGTDWTPHMGPAGQEGYLAQMNVEVDTSVSDPLPRLLGTVMQDNTCARCSTAFRVGTGATGTVLAGNRVREAVAPRTSTPTARGAQDPAGTALP